MCHKANISQTGSFIAYRQSLSRRGRLGRLLDDETISSRYIHGRPHGRLRDVELRRNGAWTQCRPAGPSVGGNCASLGSNSTTRTPATDTTNGQAHNNSTTNLPHHKARAQHLHMSRCWDVANFFPLVVTLLYNKL